MPANTNCLINYGLVSRQKNTHMLISNKELRIIGVCRQLGLLETLLLRQCQLLYQDEL